MEKIVALCKRRGFIFPSSEIYGGVGSTYDYGHYGVLLKTNVKNEWWRAMLQERDDIVAIDSAILQHPRVWEASGHLAGFTDPLVDCKTCGQRFRADHLAELAVRAQTVEAPGRDRRVRADRGARLQPDVRDDDRPRQGVRLGGLPRPETAQGIFINFKNVLQFSRKKPPFGIAQVGKSFRNEITPGNFIFRTREFEQMEMEFFVPPDEAPTVVRALARQSASAGTSSSGSDPTNCVCARTTPTSSPTTPRARATWNTSSRSAGPSSRGSPTAATSTSPSTPSSPARSSSTSTRPPASATCPT